MKILIISDNHGRLENFRRVMGREAPFDVLVHAGDVMGTEDEMERIAGMPLVVVRGNCDGWTSFAPSERFFYAQRTRAFLTHGHLYDVHTTANRLVSKARKEKCGIAVFGHTHVPGIEWIPDGQGSHWRPDDDGSKARKEWFRVEGASSESAVSESMAPESGKAASRMAGEMSSSVRATDAGKAGLRVSQEDGLLLMNPGSLERPRQRGFRPSYIVLTAEPDGSLEAEVRYL